MRLNQAIGWVKEAMSPDLVRPKYRTKIEEGAHPLTGACYVVCEAIWHLMGEKKSGLKPHYVKVDDDNHFYLVDEKGKVIDPTVEQFSKKPKYTEGKPFGWMTVQPSERARKLMKRIKTLAGDDDD